MRSEGDLHGAGARAPLDGVRVIDATDAYGAYAGRLLADLGAEVIRIESPEGNDLRGHPPTVDLPTGPLSAFDWFVNLNKRSVTLDLRDPDQRSVFLGLVATADVLLEGWPSNSPDSFSSAELEKAQPTLVRVSITPFGHGGPWTNRQACDLTSLAAGGLLSLGGYPDTEPIAVYGSQSLLAASIFGAIAALIGLVAREGDGRGRHFDVSAQEAVAAAMEDSIPQFDLTGRVRRRLGDSPREAGTGIFTCRDGYVAIVAGRLGTARAWTALTRWLVEEGAEGAEELQSPEWQEFGYRQRPEAIERFRLVFERFASRWTRQELYLEAQRRSIALAPVNDVGDVVADRQLVARRFFEQVEVKGVEAKVLVPGRPYRLSGAELPPLRPAPLPGESTGLVLADVATDPAESAPRGRRDV